MTLETRVGYKTLSILHNELKKYIIETHERMGYVVPDIINKYITLDIILKKVK